MLVTLFTRYYYSVWKISTSTVDLLVDEKTYFEINLELVLHLQLIPYLRLTRRRVLLLRSVSYCSHFICNALIFQ